MKRKEAMRFIENAKEILSKSSWDTTLDTCCKRGFEECNSVY